MGQTLQLGCSFVLQLLPCPSSLGNSKNFAHWTLFFSTFCASSAAPDVKGSGRGEIKQPLKQTNSWGQAHTKPCGFLRAACDHAGSRGLLSCGWTLHSSTKPPQRRAQQSPVHAALKARSAPGAQLSPPIPQLPAGLYLRAAGLNPKPRSEPSSLPCPVTARTDQEAQAQTLFL